MEDMYEYRENLTKFIEKMHRNRLPKLDDKVSIKRVEGLSTERWKG
jgi:hypothetical protein